nr:DUF3800 domain-containing protein [Bacillus sonorensis]
MDDSGQLHPNYRKSDYFIYGGLLLKESDFHGVNRAYTDFMRQVKKDCGAKGEFKTTDMPYKIRRRVLNRLKKFNVEQVFVSVKISACVRLNFNSGKDVNRFKNYLVRRLIDKLISTKKIPKNCSLLDIHIDNQNVAHSAKDSLEEHLKNYFNEDDFYYVHKARDTTKFSCDFRVFYKDSSSHYLIQAADTLANTKWNILNGKQQLRRYLKDGYTIVKLPDGIVY